MTGVEHGGRTFTSHTRKTSVVESKLGLSLFSTCLSRARMAHHRAEGGFKGLAAPAAPTVAKMWMFTIPGQYHRASIKAHHLCVASSSPLTACRSLSARQGIQQHPATILGSSSKTHSRKWIPWLFKVLRSSSRTSPEFCCVHIDWIVVLFSVQGPSIQGDRDENDTATEGSESCNSPPSSSCEASAQHQTSNGADGPGS